MTFTTRPFGTALMLPGLGLALAGCPKSPSTPSTPSEVGQYALTVVAKADRGAPDDYDVRPGAAMDGAEVSVVSLAEGEAVPLAGTTDPAGRAAFLVGPGAYSVSVQRATHDPYCWWFGSVDVEITDGPETASLTDLWVACE